MIPDWDLYSCTCVLFTTIQEPERNRAEDIANIWEFQTRIIADCLSDDLLIGSVCAVYRAAVVWNQLTYVWNVFLECLWHSRIALGNCSSFRNLFVAEFCRISLTTDLVKLLQSESSAVTFRFRFYSLLDFCEIDCASEAQPECTRFPALLRVPIVLLSKFETFKTVLDHHQSWSKNIEVVVLQGLKCDGAKLPVKSGADKKAARNITIEWPPKHSVNWLVPSSRQLVLMDKTKAWSIRRNRHIRIHTFLSGLTSVMRLCTLQLYSVSFRGFGP